MTMPYGYDKKKNLESKILELEDKLKVLNSILDKGVNPYHIHHEDVQSEEDINRMSKSIDKKIIETQEKSIHKGIKIKHLLIIVGMIIVITVGMVSYPSSNYQVETDYNPETIETPSSPYTAPVIESMSAQCKTAYELGPNNWYKENCMK